MALASAGIRILERLKLVTPRDPLPSLVRLDERGRGNTVRQQARPSWDLSGTGISNPFLRVPQHQNLRLYEQLVETVPLINAALGHIVRLVGCPTVEAKPDTQAEIMEWMDGIRVNRVQTGISNWFSTWLMDMLTYGRAHAEIILPTSRDDIFAVQELHPRTIELRPRSTGYGVDTVQIMAFGGQDILLNPRLILTAVHDVRTDSPQGNSLLYGLPFVAEILAVMMRSLQETYRRFGSPVYHLNWNPPDSFSDPDGTAGRAYLTAMSARLTDSLKSRMDGNTRDLLTQGNITLEVVGAAGETLDFVMPARAIAEQIVAKTGLPPMLLGLQWSTTERMSSVQTGLLSEMIDEIRHHVEAELSYLIRLRQLLVGSDPEFKLAWDAPTLIDEFETARTKLVDAQGDAVAIKTDKELWEIGVIDQYEFVRRHRPEYSEKSDAEIKALLPLLSALPPKPMPPPGFGQGGPPQGDDAGQREEQQLRALLGNGNGNGRH